MNKSEKAKELVDEFYNEIPKLGVTMEKDTKAYQVAKQCALITVRHVLELLTHLPTNGYRLEYRDIIEHCEGVKKEIKLL